MLKLQTGFFHIISWCSKPDSQICVTAFQLWVMCGQISLCACHCLVMLTIRDLIPLQQNGQELVPVWDRRTLSSISRLLFFCDLFTPLSISEPAWGDCSNSSFLWPQAMPQASFHNACLCSATSYGSAPGKAAATYVWCVLFYWSYKGFIQCSSCPRSKHTLSSRR